MHSSALALGFTALAVVWTAAPGHAGGEHVDHRIGYSIKVPREFDTIPIKTNEEWLVAKFLSTKTDFWTDPDMGWTIEHKPEIQVIAFIDAVINRDEVEVDEEGKEVKIRLDRVFHDYKEYMKGSYVGGGYYFSEEETGEHKELPVTKYELKVEKGTTGQGPKRIITWVYDLDFADVAIHYEVLEAAYKKHKSAINKTLKSFKLVERTEGLNIDSMSQEGGFTFTFSGMEDMTPDQRRVRRQEQERQLWAEATKNLPDGWTAKEISGVPVLTREDLKHAKKVVSRVQAVMGFLDKTFPEVGTEEYVRTPIIRICESPDEEMAFREGSTGWGAASIEIVTHKSNSGATSFEWEYVNKRAFSHWFQDKDISLYWSLPPWLKFGLEESIGAADVKGSSLDFKIDPLERDVLRDAERNGNLLSARELMKFTEADFSRFQQQREYGPLFQTISLVRFFIDGAASRNKSTKDVLSDYVQNVEKVLAAIEKEEEEKSKDKSDDSKPQTEEEEEERFRQRREAAQARRGRVMQEAFDLTFGSWSNDDWSQFEAAYERTIK